MKTHIARTAGVVVAVLALDYLLLVGIGLFLTKVLGKGSALVESEDELNKSLEDGRTPTDGRRHLPAVRAGQHRRDHRRDC